MDRAPQIFRFENLLNFLSPSFYEVTTGLHIFAILYYTQIFIKGENFLIYGGVDLQKILALGQKLHFQI